jgi:tetratricopeptide (TPR) repeat protein
MAPARLSTLFSGSRLWLIVLLVLAGVFAYANTLRAPFIFDDLDAIRDNASIRSLGTALFPPHDGSGVDSRPVVNLSLAVNYAVDGLDVRAYHATNLAIHVLAGLALYGVVRRTLLIPVGRGLRSAPGVADGGERSRRPTGLADDETATRFALAAALLWLLHPLQTESVTCVIQRTESLMGLFYLATFYGFVRSVEPTGGQPWRVFSVAMCLLGMGTKEVMVSAPLLVLLYDRTFVANSFRAAWQARRGYYAALAATWLLLAGLVLSSGGARGGAAGTATGITPWTYALTQCEAIGTYLKLTFWPAPLVLDYGTGVVTNLGAVLPQAVLVLVVVAGTVFALWRRPVWGFLGAWFLVILAPSSSVLPLVTQTIAEHRMYLSLAAVIVASGLLLHRWLGRHVAGVGVLLALACGGLTAVRNHDYRSTAAIWQDTVEKVPANARAHSNLGQALGLEGRADAAMAELREAIRLQPNLPYAHYNLGLELAKAGRDAEAVPEFEAELKLLPAFAPAWCELGLSLYQLGRRAEAVAAYEKALQLRPEYVDALERLGIALGSLGRLAEAMTRYQLALRLAPERASLHLNAGIALAQMRQLEPAIQQFQAAVNLDPDFGQAHLALAQALAETGRPAEAAQHRVRAQSLMAQPAR